MGYCQCNGDLRYHQCVDIDNDNYVVDDKNDDDDDGDDVDVDDDDDDDDNTDHNP